MEMPEDEDQSAQPETEQAAPKPTSIKVKYPLFLVLDGNPEKK